MTPNISWYNDIKSMEAEGRIMKEPFTDFTVNCSSIHFPLWVTHGFLLSAGRGCILMVLQYKAISFPLDQEETLENWHYPFCICELL